MTDSVFDDTERALLVRFAERARDQRRLARHEDYVYDKAQEAFWDIRNGTLHSEKSVDASIPQDAWRVVEEDAPEGPADAPEAPVETPRRRGRPPGRPGRERRVKPSLDIMRVENDKFVEGSTWWPGREHIIRNEFIDNFGSRPSHGARILNLYRPPPEMEEGKAEEAARWIEHVQKLWPDPAEHNYFFDYCAHMLQRPEQKANAAVILSGAQGIGKDAALYPVRIAVGSWNVKNIDPDDLFSPFKPWVQTLMLVVNEVRPTKDEFHASSMYNILKPLIAAPPDTLPLNDKNQKVRYVVNVMRVFMTTNNWLSMYIPPDDRRMFIMHSSLPKQWHIAAGIPDYFRSLFHWFDGEGGAANVAAFLRARDISSFDPKSAPVRTDGWQAVAASWDEPEDGVRFALEKLGWPDVIFGAELADPQFDDYEEVVKLLKSPRRTVVRMAQSGYRQGPPPPDYIGSAVDRRWIFRAGSVDFRSRMVFVREDAQLLNGAAITAIVERGKRLALVRAGKAEPIEIRQQKPQQKPPVTH
jgi:hypothetical protein